MKIFFFKEKPHIADKRHFNATNGNHQNYFSLMNVTGYLIKNSNTIPNNSNQ